MIFVTGDTHGEWSRFSTISFPEQNEMTRDDFIIVCGDFGIWHDCAEERYLLDWLSEKKFTLLFVDGNHENYDRLIGGEFPVMDFHDGKAHKIRENIYHLMRGYVFNLCGNKFFTFGGASSHDIDDGILNPEDYKDKKALAEDYNRRTNAGQMLRINHISWWENELPSKEEMDRGLESLASVNNSVDYVITHCLPSSVVAHMYAGDDEPDTETKYFEELLQNGLTFNKWFAGHYHVDGTTLDKYRILYHDIERIL